ncbi:hypothetical protein [Pleomorphovibrio marinus]|uniref:hypothetical protein n=1 Tax=Pleomorphovibrio marinus TaxID=2164132 RepID=UPI000E09E500|nr:hypothetical protein [Pleomorphovibrio marinus]
MVIPDFRSLTRTCFGELVLGESPNPDSFREEFPVYRLGHALTAVRTGSISLYEGSQKNGVKGLSNRMGTRMPISCRVALSAVWK